MNWLLLVIMIVISGVDTRHLDELDRHREEVVSLVESGGSLSDLRHAVRQRHTAEDAAITAGSGVQGQLSAAEEPYLAELRAARTGVSSVWGLPSEETLAFAREARLRSNQLATSAWTASLAAKDRDTRTRRATAAGLRGAAMLESIRDATATDAWVRELDDTEQLLKEAIELAQGPRGVILQSAAIVAAAKDDLTRAQSLIKQARSEPRGLDGFSVELIEASIAAGGIQSSHRIAAAHTIAQQQLTPSKQLFLAEWLLRASLESGAERSDSVDHAVTILQSASADDRRLLIRPIAELVQRIPGPPTSHPLDQFGRARRFVAVGEAEKARSEFLAVGDGSQPLLQPEAWLELAQLELAQGDSQAASNALIKAVAAEPTHPSSLQAARLAVRIAERNNNELQTTQELINALPNHPDRYQWRILLGEHALSQHQLQDALELWRNIPTIAPESVKARRLAAEVILELPRGKLSRSDEALQAVEALESSLQSHPEQRITYLAKILRIRALLAIERRSEAARLAETLFDIEAVPNDLRPRAISAGLDAFRATNRNEDAARLLDSFARIDPEGNAKFSRHLLKRGAAHIRRLLDEGETEQAKAEALRLVTDAAIPANATIEAELPEDPWQAIEAAMVLRIAGEHGRALDIASAAMLIHPDASEVILEKAEALAAQGTPATSQEALVLFKRLRPGVQRGSRAWWICELRQLEILEQMEVNLHLISPRIKRLRLVDPNLGGAEIQRSFESLQARAAHRALE